MQQHELFILKRELMILGFLCAFIFGILIGLLAYETKTGHVTATAIFVGNQLIQR